jgi:sucrose-6-phosphate hydrolase SacC (GH32 family)
VFAASPFDDAVGFWQMNDVANTPNKALSLNVVENVQLGVALSVKEQAESKLRGGDGKVAKITSGGYLFIAPEDAQDLDITGKKLSICIRLCVPASDWDFPILSKHGGHERLSFNIYGYPMGIGCEIGTTFNNRMITASAPFRDMLPRQEAEKAWHDVICRVDGAKLELFIDGRCVDEEFLLGELRTNAIPFMIGAESYGGNVKADFEGLIDHVAIWNRSLSNDEIITLSGGKERADLRERTDRGIPGESLQYWRPPNNYYVGDCLPFYDPKEETFHFAYLLDKGHHGAKNGYGAHQWAQATSTDLKNWKHQPLMLPVTEQWEGSICTGSVFVHDGKFYAYYATRAVKDYPAPGGKHYSGEFVGYAISTDGIHFTKQSPNPLVILPREEGYSAAGRDPVVFQDERDKLFHMYITTDFKNQGAWAHLTSKDLKQWNLTAPELAGGGTPECPDWFKWGDTYYLIVNWGNGYYRTSATPVGPWEKPETPDVLMPGVPRVPKTAAFKNGRRIICGWTNENGFGGHAVFHELLRQADGTLLERFVPEMIPQTGAAIVSEKNLSGKKTFSNLPKNLRLQSVIEFDAKVTEEKEDWAMVYYQDDSRRDMVRLSPSTKTVILGRHSIEQVDFSTGKIELDMFIKNAVADLCINGQRTVTNTIPDFPFREITVNDNSTKFRITSFVISPVQTE